ncbi:GNAT family N-acetyltransferase [Pseudoalteromonas ardens]|uniref:Acetyltransferase n=1 Tax=Pseudoalteromonas rubra TaxID=43658 RepID=A0A0L0EQ85_9GAMM|nr:GNAT family N-acetyltransferase [Pseudoalteromonas sp. R96]KNC66058.1 acetyltransferase [Pseudoalteromonas rubra]MDK1313023.1 GNAT family N-acetyltransferase [Pseudoalteromonas sp. R96]
MIRIMTQNDFQHFWPTFKEIIEQQETYAFDPDMSQQQAYALWCQKVDNAYVMAEGDEILGSYYLKANAMGPSNHICNCGYMVAPQARGKGVARTLCEHSQSEAIKLGYRAMQFNSVVASNQVAVQLWQRLGYQIIGTIPKAYRHPRLGFVDSHIMYKWLQ